MSYVAARHMCHKDVASNHEDDHRTSLTTCVLALSISLCCASLVCVSVCLCQMRCVHARVTLSPRSLCFYFLLLLNNIRLNIGDSFLTLNITLFRSVSFMFPFPFVFFFFFWYQRFRSSGRLISLFSLSYERHGHKKQQAETRRMQKPCTETRQIRTRDSDCECATRIGDGRGALFHRLFNTISKRHAARGVAWRSDESDG